ncbi:MAG: protein-L-isoaspartate O-methyltransferase, partial [Thermodesulfovibrionales bacterium]|nr:protein-L-isoaspartate O-methyltransferase [Thermodesulfovibrionales bacterium]
IVVTAAAPRIPALLLEQLAKGGRLIMPVGPVETSQRLTLVTRDREGRLSYQYREGVRFVPMTGKIQE